MFDSNHTGARTRVAARPSSRGTRWILHGSDAATTVRKRNSVDGEISGSAVTALAMIA